MDYWVGMRVGTLKSTVIYLVMNNSDEPVESVMESFISGFKKKSPSLLKTLMFCFVMLQFWPQVAAMSVLWGV